MMRFVRFVPWVRQIYGSCVIDCGMLCYVRCFLFVGYRACVCLCRVVCCVIDGVCCVVCIVNPSLSMVCFLLYAVGCLSCGVYYVLHVVVCALRSVRCVLFHMCRVYGCYELCDVCCVCLGASCSLYTACYRLVGIRCAVYTM